MFLGLRFGLSVVSSLVVGAKSNFVTIVDGVHMPHVINIFSCIDVNLEVSFINPTLPLAEMNKKIFAEIDHCNSCVVERMLKTCECGMLVRSGYWNAWCF